jgi:DNA-binding FadR family transcriptional regulator
MDLIDHSRNLTQQLTYELGRAIVQGKYRVDSTFPTEADLSAQFNISRSVTREAVKMLTAKGLICSRPRKGIRVQPAHLWNMFDSDVLNWTLAAKPSLQLLKEFTQLRVAIEPEAVALACRVATDAQIEAIGSALARMEMAEQGDDDPLDADIQFHTRILEASNNRFFIQFCDFIQTALRISIACTNQLKSVKAASAYDHRSVYEAISRRDRNGARDAMRLLLEEAMELITESMVEAPRSPVVMFSTVPA